MPDKPNTLKNFNGIIKAHRGVAWLAAFLLACSTVIAQTPNGTAFFNPKSVPWQGESISKYRPDIRDTITWDTLYQVRARNGFPVSYFRKVQASVCFDNKCRLLNIILHWNVTGRYLGFELPAGEYLSKAEHEPFTSSEYERLHDILSNPVSPLRDIAYNELVPSNYSEVAEIDAVSSATAKNLLELVVEGAAFTTYKIWHIIHGSTADEVARLTAEVLSPKLLVTILRGPQAADRIWALNHRKLLKFSTLEMQDALLECLKSKNYNVVERAIDAVTIYDLKDESFQRRFLMSFDDLSYALRKPLLLKLGQSPALFPPVITELGGRLNQLSGDLVGAVLKVFSEKQIQDESTLRSVAAVLSNPNFHVSKQAFDFLHKVGPNDPEILQRLRAYAKERNLR